MAIYLLSPALDGFNSQLILSSALFVPPVQRLKHVEQE